MLLCVRSHQIDEQAPQRCVSIGAEPPSESPQLSAISQFVSEEGSSLCSESGVLTVS